MKGVARQVHFKIQLKSWEGLQNHLWFPLSKKKLNLHWINYLLSGRINKSVQIPVTNLWIMKLQLRKTLINPARYDQSRTLRTILLLLYRHICLFITRFIHKLSFHLFLGLPTLLLVLGWLSRACLTIICGFSLVMCSFHSIQAFKIRS
jgi:hypothetical protein